MLLKRIGYSLLLTCLFLSLFWLSLAQASPKQPGLVQESFAQNIDASERLSGMPLPSQLSVLEPQPNAYQELGPAFIRQTFQPTQTFPVSSPPITLPIKGPAFDPVSNEQIQQANSTSNQSDYIFNSYGTGNFFLPPYPAASDRMGFGKASAHDASILNAGWYVDWHSQLKPAHPGGAEYAHTILFNVHGTGAVCNNNGVNPASNLSQVTPILTGTALIDQVQINPGALWLIGNEPDAIYNGSPIEPELYAELYHYFYTTIKTADPSAKVAVGAVVQPSPLRMAYLDKILTHYSNTYGQPLPIDVWNIHVYLLNEVVCSWGASIPPGLTGPGWQLDYRPEVLLNINAIESSLRSFRQWMHDRGYGDKPLIITEYGVLPDFADNYVIQFMNSSSSLFQSATDPVTGYAADQKRLVQMWAWFSTHSVFDGDLFQPGSNTLSVIGQNYRNHINAGHTPYIDLQVIPPVDVTHLSPKVLNTSAYIRNQGNSNSSNVKVKLALVEAASGLVAAETTLTLPPFQKRYSTPPLPIGYTWNIDYSSTPPATIPYTLTISVTSPDDVTINNQIAVPFSWWPLTDLAVSDMSFSSDPVFVYKEPKSIVVTATVANQGIRPTPATSFKFTLQTPNGQITDLSASESVPALQPNESVIFTTNVLIDEPGSFTVTGMLPDKLGPAEVTNNNHLPGKIVAASPNAYLPLVRKP